MPQPQLPPQQANPSQEQQQTQNTQANPVSSVTTDTPSNSSSISEAENVSSTSSNLSSYQVNNQSATSYFRFANGTQTPGTSLYSNVTYNNNGWDNHNNLTATIGITHTLGGRNKKLALESVALDNQARKLSICNGLGVFSGKVQIDYSMMPQLQDCEYITQVAVVPQASPVAELRAQMQEYQRLVAEQQRTIELFQQRLTQYKIDNKRVRVGG